MITSSHGFAVAVKNEADALVLGRVLSRAFVRKHVFYVAGDGLLLASLARNIMVREGGPLLVVMDAHTTHEETLDESRGLTDFTIRMIAGDDADVEVFAFAPELDVIFFEAPSVLRRRLCADLHELEVELGKVDSSRTLRKVLERTGQSPEAFYESLDNRDLDALLKGAQLSRLIRAAEALMRHAAAVAEFVRAQRELAAWRSE